MAYRIKERNRQNRRPDSYQNNPRHVSTQTTHWSQGLSGRAGEPEGDSQVFSEEAAEWLGFCADGKLENQFNMVSH